MHLVIGLHCSRLLQPLQEGIHAGHHEGVACESSDDVVDPCCLLRVSTGHELLGTAHHANRKPATEGLPVANDVSLHVIGPLCSTRMKTKARVNLIEDQANACFGAGLLQLVEPLFVSWRRTHFAVVGGQDSIARWRLVEMEALKGIHEDRCDLAATKLNHLQGQVVHVLQAKHVLWQPLIAGHGLHSVPPAMVRTAEGYDQWLLGVEARHTHGAHHCLRARHMEGHLILARDLAQTCDVVQNDIVQRAQEEALLLGTGPSFLDEVFVLLIAADIDTIGSGNIHGTVLIEVDHVDALGAIQGHGRIQVFLDHAIEGREAPSGSEAKV
mmetsp:Transcript_20002/g.46984  ORF Transcript_20002/g.46984 Transcript_20002/m.46984 type:complete len:327 (+) Transcript_20002:542-1522(+)